ncbi:hypothetical protein MWU78_22105 [Arenibacter sp. F26102]|uniref:hypothetical protein n=1 Tax=Arenibacter sp. F26102 TaxID=2926416 RepID=UPI001FF56299|nr:hypothetical protein [Arenibacter sp. F26102]MCK0148352.1 hypothetical protein [Arenibacter sp. F26102]
MKKITTILICLIFSNVSCQETLKTNDKSFIIGLKNSKVASVQEVSKGFNYILKYPNETNYPNRLNIKRVNGLLELSVNFINGSQTILPFEFITYFGGSGGSSELRKERQNDEYTVGQHDFDNDGIEEILIGLKDKYSDDYSSVDFFVYKYFPPLNIKDTNRIENWKVYGHYQAPDILGDTKVIVKGAKVSVIMNAEADLYMEWTFEKDDFTEKGQI